MPRLEGIRAARVLFAGGAHLDRRARAHTPFVPAASSPGTLLQSPGGAALNAAMAWRACGGGAVLWSARGGDPDGAVLETAVAAAGITDLSTVWLDRRTGSYTAVLDDAGDLVAGIADMAIYERLQPRFLARVHVRRAIAECGGILLDANLPEDTIARLAEIAATAGIPVGAIGVSPAKAGRLRGVLPHLDAVFLSRAEAGSLLCLAPDMGLEALAGPLAQAGARRAVVTDGSRPALIVDGDEAVLQAPLALAARDVTEAGDTLAAVAFGLLASSCDDFTASTRQGMAAASVRVAEGRLPSPGEFAAAIERVAAAMPAPDPATKGTEA